MAYLLCSQAEALAREASCDLHSLESTSETRFLAPSRRRHDPNNVVKKHVRNNTEEPRALERLHLVVAHLVALWRGVRAEVHTAELGPRPDAAGMSAVANNLASHYVFIVDRLTAVRQDLVALNIPPTLPLLRLLETIFDFYVSSLYECCKMAALMQHRHSVANRWFDQTLHQGSMYSCASLVGAASESLLLNGAGKEVGLGLEVGCRVASLEILLKLFSHLQAVCSGPHSAARAMYVVPNIAQCAIASKLALPENEMFVVAVQVIAAVRCGNFDRAVLLFDRMMAAARPRKLRVLVATVFALTLPAMRRCRALLLDKASGKDDSVTLACAAKKLYADPAHAAELVSSIGLQLRGGEVYLKIAEAAGTGLSWDEPGCLLSSARGERKDVFADSPGGGLVARMLDLVREDVV